MSEWTEDEQRLIRSHQRGKRVAKVASGFGCVAFLGVWVLATLLGAAWHVHLGQTVLGWLQ